MRTTVKFVAALVAVFSVAHPLTAHASLTRLAEPTTNLTESRLFVKFDAAFDSANQVHLVVWGTQSFGPANGVFLNNNGAAVSGRFGLSDGPYQAGWARVIYSAEQGKFLVSYTKILGPGIHQRVARFVTYQSGSAAVSPEIIIDTWNGGAGGEPGMAYSRGRFLVSWWNWNSNPPQSYVAVLDANGTILVPRMTVSRAGDGQTDPELACDSSRGRCLVIGQAWGVFSPDGRTPGTWAQFIDDQSAQPIGGPFFLDFFAVEKEASIAYSAVGNRFIVAFSRLQNSIWAVTVDSQSLAPSAPYALRLPGQDPDDGGGYGRPRLVYNPTTGSTLVAIKPWIARTGALELDGGGGIVGGTWQMTAAIGPWTQGTQEIAPSADPTNSRFLIADNQAFVTMRSSVYSTTGGGTLPGPGPGTPSSPVKVRERKRADFNGDGKYDLLWQNIATGQLSAWELSGTTVLADPLMNPSVGDNNWRLSGTGDFNGDGKPDIVWHHRTGGWISIWYMDGVNRIAGTATSIDRVADTRWKIVGVGDFNNDAKPDIVWQHDDGWIAVWMMNGATVLSSNLMSPDRVADTRWKIAAVGDLNGDGQTDLVWRSTNGWIAAWLMTGLSMGQTYLFNPSVVADPGWRIAGLIDVNMDDQLDLVWHHDQTGFIAVWYLNNVTAVGTGFVGTGVVSDTNWKLMGPK
jgi:hypothetical protein